MFCEEERRNAQTAQYDCVVTQEVKYSIIMTNMEAPKLPLYFAEVVTHMNEK